jgi:hypothetical protein
VPGDILVHLGEAYLYGDGRDAYELDEILDPEAVHAALGSESR